MSKGQPASSKAAELPRIDGWLMDGFEKFFLPKFLRKHFHSVAVHRSNLPEDLFCGDGSMIVYANHAAWWDPMIALYLRRQLFPRYRLYAPIDAAALERYKIFSRMGFYGIALNSASGAAEFLRRSQTILASPGASIWITPEGKFCDVRDVNQPLMPGLAHLAHRVARDREGESSKPVWIVPVAMEYVFWEERLPECLCLLGEPIRVERGRAEGDKAWWSQRLTSALRDAQRDLAAASIARDSSQFELILSGRGGTWSIYDFARRLTARLRGKQLRMDHSDKLHV